MILRERWIVKLRSRQRIFRKQRGQLMAYEWDKDLETGYEVIDRQHKQLVETVNRLQAAKAAGKGADEIGEIIDFLLEYTDRHFREEEALQQAYQYPDYYVHLGYHEDFRRQVAKLVERVNAEGPTSELIDETTQTVGDWLVHHIRGDDFRMAAFVQSEDRKRKRRRSERGR
jgi:hemerythrin